MNNSIFQKVLKTIPLIDLELQKIDQISDENILNFLNTDFGISNSLSYIKDVLILEEFKKDIFYFKKEVKDLLSELDSIDQDSHNFFLFSDVEDYDKIEKQEQITSEFVQNYKKILFKIKDSFNLNYNGEKSKFFIKENLRYSTSEEIFYTVKQPNNICPYIDEDIKNHPELKDNLEELRSQCELKRESVNDFKKDIWNNSELKLSFDDIILTFRKTNFQKKEKYINKEIKELRSFKEYQKLIEWENQIINFSKNNDLIFLDFE